MCGRYFFQLQNQQLPLISNFEQLALFDFHQGEIFPTQQTLVITFNGCDVVGQVMKWGIKSCHGNILINARSEGIHERKTFRPLLTKRCLIIANGFYEWHKHGSHKDKIYIRKKNQPYLFMAGIYNEQGEYVIVTGASQKDMAQLHHRTPIIMDEYSGLNYLEQKQSFTVDNEGLIFQKV